MHGVQPNAKAIPTTIAPNGPAGFDFACTRFSASSAPMRNSPRVCSPNTMMRRPAILSSRRCLDRRNAPIAEAVAPSAMNTSEKPTTNANDVIST
jgi:hypothetical protein